MNDRRRNMNFRWKVTRGFLSTCFILLWTTWVASAAPIVTIQPDEPAVSSCIAFGAAPGSGIEGPDSGFIFTSPYMGFIYKNVPAFNLNPGDVLAFDLGDVNDFDVELDIYIAATITNGETIQAGAFQKIVSNTYLPLTPRGDKIIGNFDMRFVVDSAFDFPGGGLIIRFSNGSAAYRADNDTCDQVGVVATSNDGSENFVVSFWKDEDGIAPWSPDASVDLRETLIAGFQVIEGPTVLLASETLDSVDTAIATASAGDTVVYRVTAQNPGDSDATGVVVTATLDDAVEYIQSTPNPATGVIFDAGPPATIEWSVGSLATSAEATLEIELDIPFSAGGRAISNNAEVTGSDAPYKQGLSTQSDIEIDQSISILGAMLDTTGTGIVSVSAGEPFIYQITANNSSAIDGTNVELTVSLPENLQYQQATAPPPTTAVFNAGPPETVVWTVGALTAAQSVALDIDVIPLFASSGVSLVGRASLTAPSLVDDVLTNMPIRRAIEISTRTLDNSGAEIITAKTGDTISYETVVRNNSQAVATGLEVTAALSGLINLQQSIPTPAAVTTVNPAPPATVLWEIDTLQPAAEAMLVVDLDIPFAASGEQVRNGAQLTGSDAQALLGERGTSDIDIDDSISMSATTVDSTGSTINNASISDSITYELVVRNEGGVDATGLEIVTTLAENQRYLQAAAQPAPAFNAGPPATVTWNLGTLAPESDSTLNVELEINFGAGGLSLVNSTEITTSDASLVTGLTAESQITIDSDGVDLLNGGSGNCFIATAAYGSYLEPEVMVLRAFRDKYLLTNEPGKVFVNWYYRHSPTFAARIAENEAARLVTRLLLSPIVYSVKYPFAAVVSVFSIGLIGWMRRSTRVAR